MRPSIKSQFTSGMLWRRGLHDHRCCWFWTWKCWSLALISLDNIWSTGISPTSTSPSNFSSCFLVILIFISLPLENEEDDDDDDEKPGLWSSSSKLWFSGTYFFCATEESQSSPAHAIDDTLRLLSFRQLPIFWVPIFVLKIWGMYDIAGNIENKWCGKEIKERGESGAAYCVWIYRRRRKQGW